ncbi:uncharacterized protein LACBIDRAFT_316215 [Laccaria bicolor S238N-H82]|uniref:Predicted protein n=1 Tax=Laccaria bicolor (strain S238N-H82 / ATCC MYA-4686) TaxID=486041 RepID=B0E0G1_LACBS|nr:uncharacterized protein LACBIDRAFT_316215 [Laccaria bicolor S238N-H82]EDQ99680.1 predicted protein [Laccaria bicolor S238N-H82]|eukprot:XP_001889657.1 predicted protein [Laccaria bicolor S238N-H82]
MDLCVTLLSVDLFMRSSSCISTSHQLLTKYHNLSKDTSTSNLHYLSNMNRRLRSATISTKENVPDVAPPKRGRRASIHTSSAPSIEAAADPGAPFSPANDAGRQDVGYTQVKYGPPKKKSATAAAEGPWRPSNAKVLFDGVHLPARNVANEAAVRPTANAQTSTARNVANEAAVRPKAADGPASEAAAHPNACHALLVLLWFSRVTSRVWLLSLQQTLVTGILLDVTPAEISSTRLWHASNNPGNSAVQKPALKTYVSACKSTPPEPVAPAAITAKKPALKTYGSARKSTPPEPAAPASSATNADNSNHTLSDLTSTHSDDEDITLPDQPEEANSFSSFDINDLPSDGRVLTGIRNQDFHPRSLTIHDLDYDEVQEMREACESKHTAYCFSYTDQTTQYYHGREMTEGCQTAANWFTKYLEDDTKQWLLILQGFTAPHLPENYVDALNILREEDELHVNSYVIKAAMALDKTRNSGEDPFEILSLEDDLSWDDKNGMQSLLCSEAVTYRFTQPWDGGHHHYQGSLPQRGEQDAADRLIQVFLEESGEYVPIPEGYTAPREPYDHIDTLNWEKIAHERA